MDKSSPCDIRSCIYSVLSRDLEVTQIETSGYSGHGTHLMITLGSDDKGANSRQKASPSQ